MATEEKLTKNEFIELIPHLSMQELLLVEYRIQIWQSMLSDVGSNQKTFRCNLCGIAQHGFKNTQIHIDGKKHKAKMMGVEQLFHPNYTYAKNQRSQAQCNEKNSAKTSSSVPVVTKENSSRTPLNAPIGVNKQENKAKSNASVKTPVNSNVKKLLPKNLIPAKVNPTKPNIQSKQNKQNLTANAVIAENKNTSSQNLSEHTTKKVAPIVKQINIAKPAINQQKATTKVISAEKPTVALTTVNPQTNLKTNTANNVKASENVNNIPTLIQSNAETSKKPTSNGSIIETSNKNCDDKSPGKKLQSNIRNDDLKQKETTIKTVKRSSLVTTKVEMFDNEESEEIQCTQQTGTEQSEKCVNNVNTTDTNEQMTLNESKEVELERQTQAVGTVSTVKDISQVIQKESIIENNTLEVIELEDPVTKNSNAKIQIPKKVPNIHLKNMSLLLKADHINKNQIISPRESQASQEKLQPKKACPSTSETKLNKNTTIRHQHLISLIADDLNTASVTNTSVIHDSEQNKKIDDNNDNHQNHVSPIRSEKSNTSNYSDVIIIDDEKGDVCISSKRANETQGDEEGETFRKKQKLLLNPAAAFIAKSIQNQNEANETVASPYVCDKIITPSKLRIKPIGTTAPVINLVNEPCFSNKTYSCKTNDDLLGLIGVEYVIKILKHRYDITPRYECGLCELIFDGYAMQNHLLGYGHRLKYCEKHFPSALSQYKLYMANVPEHEQYKIMAPILDKLAIAIEKYHGRDLPYECMDREFNLNRHEILSKVYSLRHSTEQYGPSFTHVVDAKEVDELIAQRQHYVFKSNPKAHKTIFDKRSDDISNNSNRFCLPINSEHRIVCNSAIIRNVNQQPNMNIYPNNSYGRNETHNTVDDETHKRMVDSFLRQTTCNSRQKRRIRRLISNGPVHTEYRSRSPLNSMALRRQSLSPLRENDIWQAYRHLVDQRLTELNNVFQTYRQDPEKHPMYNVEWQKFWRRRKDEIITAGLDHRTYNYQPEWIRFFEVRIEELYSEDVENLKIQCRERLCLPMTNDELIDCKYHVQIAEEKSPCEERYDEPNTVDISSNDISKMSRQENIILPNEKTSKVVAVLRLMTALEDNLGSLGPKIIDLLAKALQVEKTSPENISDIILTTQNCFLLETAMEKFKGLVIASLFEGPKERALRKVIVDLNELLQFAEAKRKQMQPLHKPSISTPIPKYNNTNVMEPRSSADVEKKKTESITPIDKKELAVKLAAVLAAKGKTDLNSNELQELVSIYTMFEKKKFEASANTSSTTSTNTSKNSAALDSQKSLSDMLSELQKTSQMNALKIQEPQNCGFSQSSTRAFNASNNSGNNQWARTNTTVETSFQMQSMGFVTNLQNSLPINTSYNNNYALNMNTDDEYSAQNINSKYFSQNTMNANGNFFNNNNTTNNNSNNCGPLNGQGRNYSQQQRYQQQSHQQQQYQQQQCNNTQPGQQTANAEYGPNHNWMSRDRHSYLHGNNGGMPFNQNSGDGRNPSFGWRNM